MSRTLLKAFLGVLIAAIATSCAKQWNSVGLDVATNVESQILNGEDCSNAVSDSAVEIVVEAHVDFSVMGTIYDTSFSCSGTLIAPDVVLTAAHCLEQANLTLGTGRLISRAYYVTTYEDLLFMSQTSAPMVPKDAVRAKAFLQNEEFVADHENPPGLGNDHDIGLLFLEHPIHKRPALLITKEEAPQIRVGETVFIAGWGQTKEGVTSLFDLNAEPSSGRKRCGLSIINEIGTHEMQIGSDSQSVRKCFGDSGGPTYMRVTTVNGIKERLIGVTARAYDDANCSKGGVDTRVDVWLDWIDLQMRRGCETKERVWCDVLGIIKPDTYQTIAPLEEFEGLEDFLNYASVQL